MQHMRALKVFVLAMAVGTSALAGGALNGEEIYLDIRMEVVKNKKNATYICTLEETNEKGHLFKVYFVSGELKMEGYYSDNQMSTAHGEFKYYYQSGQLESTGEYREGQKYGIWLRYDEDGTEKPEKVYASLPMLKAIEKAKQERSK
jgi:hypothetical protein